MQITDFIHLHLHTEYSLLDGAIKIDELITLASQYQMPAVAMTDHGNIFGAIEFYRKAKNAGIKPIIGCEVYMAPNSRLDKTKITLDKNLPEESAFHLVLLAKDIEGYKNLTTLLTKSYIEGFYYKPRIDKEILSQHSKGLIALSACLKGEIPYYLQHENISMALKSADEFNNIFGKDNFYLELQNNGLAEQITVNKKLLELSKSLNIPFVATNDCHYLRKEDAKAHDILLCIQTGKTIKDTKRMKFETEDCYFKSQDEMRYAFKELPQALTNSLLIAEKCNLELELNKPLLPQYIPPQQMSADEFLEKITLEGLHAKFKDKPPDKYLERLTRELNIIKEMGFSSYFLIVWDFISYAKKNKISVGPGRGSAAGSLVAYALGITEIDPIKYNLLFERFLNPERISMPDIDVDFCKDRRQEVINYVSQKYGTSHVAQIITFGTMAAKAAIRDVGRAMNLPYAEVDRIAKLVPSNVSSIEEAINTEPQLKDLYEHNNTIKEMLNIAKKLEGLARHASTHAAGVVIAPSPLTEYTAFYKNPSEDIITTQFDMNSIEKIGLLKFDFLGLKTLTVIDKTLQYIRKRDNTFDITQISLDDPKTYELLISGNTTCIFQLESPGMKDVLVRMQPNRFEDLMALVALYRPGPMAWIDDFIKRKKGETEIKYELPQLREILEETYGIIIYQEQVMMIANEIAGFSMGQADILRKAMGKKDPEKMEKQKEIFIQGAEAKKIPRKKAEELFEKMEPFAKYGFNKSHSAAYAFLAYRTAYLKAHYPLEFMTANLTLDIGDTDRIVKLINECRNMSIPILPPDINKSDREFTLVDNSIRFGLEAVKGVGSSAIENIISKRKEKPFTSFRDFLTRVDTKKVNKKVIESLIKAGAFDSLYSEPPYLARAKAINQIEKLQRDSIYMMLFDQSTSIKDETKPWDEQNALKFEKEALGFYISGHPLTKYRTSLSRMGIIMLTDIDNYDDRAEVKVAGVIRDTKSKTREKNTTIYINLEDESGILEVIVFSDLYKKTSEILKNDNLIIVFGQLLKGEKVSKIIAKDIKSIYDELNNKPSYDKVVISLCCHKDKDPILKLREINKLLNLSHNTKATNGSSLYLELYFEDYYTVITIKHKPTDNLIQKLEEIVGKENVRFQY
ncbi:MAG: DNA polymerase III subunit alpha [Thermodesulfovibrionales bacterium]|nr:DNA polymerase III subunit alpha [Thermodesulfovibrionales bacterium]